MILPALKKHDEQKIAERHTSNRTQLFPREKFFPEINKKYTCFVDTSASDNWFFKNVVPNMWI